MSLCACSSDDQVLSSYQIYESSYQYGIVQNEPISTSNLFATDLCVWDGDDLHTQDVDSQVAAAAAVFNTTTLSTVYAQSVYEQVYPASTTKILTAYVALKYGNLEDTYTVSANAVDLPSDSSVANLNEGDQITLRQLLYGLLMCSGNDAAIAIAEGISGDITSFADLMNEEAKSLGAVDSHFVNPHGLHDTDHYTTVYDMYLIFNAAVSYSDFVDILHASSYDAVYTDADGNTVTQTWSTTNQYLTGYRSSPSGITVIGGKTGTTGEAGYCLVLLSQNSKNEQLISMVYGADARTNLYLLMGEILGNYGNQ